MSRAPRERFSVLFLFVLLSGPALAAGPAGPARLFGRAFGQPAEVAVLATGEPEAALREALRELEEIERLAGPAGLAEIEAAAGEARAADPRLLGLLARAASFCLWSEGMVGPLGGGLYRAGPAGSLSGEPLSAALAGAACERLALDPKAGTVRLAAGSALDLRDFAAGFAVDRAVEVLKARGVENGFVRVGAVQRGFGPGEPGGGGRGWRAVPSPTLQRLDQPISEVWLRDRAFAAAAWDDPLPRLDLRTGRPPAEATAALAVTELAADAQPLAATMLLSGTRAGEMRLGSLRPEPSVLWLLGNGGAPLLVEHNWSAVTRK